MPNNTDSGEKLDGIIQRLDIIIQLLVTQISTADIEAKGVQKEILKLCDFNNTREDIIKKTGKKPNHVDVVLNKLRNTGLIKSVQVEGKTFYIRVK